MSKRRYAGALGGVVALLAIIGGAAWYVSRGVFGEPAAPSPPGGPYEPPQPGPSGPWPEIPIIPIGGEVTLPPAETPEEIIDRVEEIIITQPQNPEIPEIIHEAIIDIVSQPDWAQRVAQHRPGWLVSLLLGRGYTVARIRELLRSWGYTDSQIAVILAS